MEQCIHRTEPEAPCGFDLDRPASNGGPFAFICLENYMPRRFPPVAPSYFGRDHFSLVVYLFTCKNGWPQPARLRLDGKRWPTRLQEGRVFPEHNDLDVIGDLETAGVLQTRGQEDIPRVEFTPEGAKLAAWLETQIQAGNVRTSDITWAQTLAGSGAVLPNPEASAAWPVPIPGPACATCDGQGCPVCRETSGPSPEYLE
jgi:hypothetical protein